MADADLTRRLEEAAKIILERAKVNASGWSARIPPSLKLKVSGDTARISSNAPPAYPNEIPGVRHPVFGGRGTKRPKAPWVTNQHRPFLAPAGDEAADAALEKFGLYVEDLAHKHGYK